LLGLRGGIPPGYESLSPVSIMCCKGRGLCVRADHSCRGVSPSLVFLNAIVKPQ
jgi:hypothetical protein